MNGGTNEVFTVSYRLFFFFSYIEPLSVQNIDIHVAKQVPFRPTAGSDPLTVSPGAHFLIRLVFRDQNFRTTGF